MAATMMRRCALDSSCLDKLHLLLMRNLKLNTLQKCVYSSKPFDDLLKNPKRTSSVDELEPFYAEDSPVRDDEIQRLRDASGLTPKLKRRLAGEPPEIEFDFMKTRIYKRRLYGRYGSKSGVDPKIMWPSKEELQHQKEDEHFFETPLNELMDKLDRRKAREKESIMKREAKIEKNMSQMKKWMQEYRRKNEVEKERVKLKNERRQRLLDEFKDRFGYTADAKDPQFKMMVRDKEEQEKAVAKQKRKQKTADIQAARLKSILDK